MYHVIIGSNSFSGFDFAMKLLSKKQKVIGISRSEPKYETFNSKEIFKNKNLKFYKYDLNTDNKKIIRLFKNIKTKFNVYNFASQSMVAQSWKYPIDWYKTNLISTVQIIENLRNMKKFNKYIHFTTPEVYGSTNKWIKENNVFLPSTPYAISRASMDFHLLALFKSFNFPVIFTRAANVYGPRQKLYRIVPKTIISILKNKKIPLYGGGKSTRSFIEISDVSDALWKISKNGKIGNTYHISTDRLITIKELVRLICKKMNKNFDQLVEIKKENSGKDLAYKLSSSKLKKELKWNSKVNLDSGIDKTLNWILKNYKKLKFENTYYIHKK